MRQISVHVDDEDYRTLKTLAERSGKPPRRDAPAAARRTSGF